MFNGDDTRNHDRIEDRGSYDVPHRWQVHVAWRSSIGRASNVRRYFADEDAARTFADLQVCRHPKAKVTVQPCAWRPQPGGAA
jgi:hypothetical protein